MEQFIVSLFVFFFVLEFLVEFVLNEINLIYVRKSWAERKIPDVFQGKVNQEDYDRSETYTLAKGRFQRWAEVYGALVALYVLFGGVLPYLDRLTRGLGAYFPVGTQATGILFCLSIGLSFSILSLPTDLYSTFALEERFGFNQTTLKLYLVDKLKGLFLAALIGIPFLFGLLWLMVGTGPYWWLWAFLFIFVFQILMVIVYPTLIAQLFNKFETLKEGEFRRRIL